MKRIISVLAAMAVMAAMLAVMAMPAMAKVFPPKPGQSSGGPPLLSGSETYVVHCNSPLAHFLGIGPDEKSVVVNNKQGIHGGCDPFEGEG